VVEGTARTSPPFRRSSFHTHGEWKPLSFLAILSLPVISMSLVIDSKSVLVFVCVWCSEAHCKVVPLSFTALPGGA
jgi:hypothetical protein